MFLRFRESILAVHAAVQVLMHDDPPRAPLG